MDWKIARVGIYWTVFFSLELRVNCEKNEETPTPPSGDSPTIFITMSGSLVSFDGHSISSVCVCVCVWATREGTFFRFVDRTNILFGLHLCGGYSTYYALSGDEGVRVDMKDN